MAGWQLQDLDLRGRGDGLRGLDPRGALLLGCTLDPDVEEDLRAGGALVFPGCRACRSTRTGPPLLPRRAVRRARDGGLRRHPGRPGLRLDPETGHDLHATLAQALHDHAIDDALAELVAGRGWSA